MVRAFKILEGHRTGHVTKGPIEALEIGFLAPECWYELSQTFPKESQLVAFGSVMSLSSCYQREMLTAGEWLRWVHGVGLGSASELE